MVGRVGEVLRLEAERIGLPVRRPVPADHAAVEVVGCVELDTGAVGPQLE